MENDVVLKRQQDSSFNFNNCICQKPGNLISIENGRRNIIEAANFLKDEVHRRLQSSTIDADFKCHMDNKCYKNYTHKKKLTKIAVSECLLLLYLHLLCLLHRFLFISIAIHFQVALFYFIHWTVKQKKCISATAKFFKFYKGFLYSEMFIYLEKFLGYHLRRTI